MGDKEQIEAHVALAYLERKEERSISSEEFSYGNPHKKEPDILYKDMGIEIGAVLRGVNTHVDIYEKKFLKTASEKIAEKIPRTIQIRLVMQDDKDTVQHEPAPQFQNYKYLPNFLDGIFIYKFETGEIEQQVVLNQKTRMREPIFPSSGENKEFNGFIDELAFFVNSLNENDFIDIDGFKQHHSVVTEGKLVKEPINPLDNFVSNKIIDKLRKDKYQGDYKTQLLLLHNYSTLANKEFTSDIHFYSHHRDDIFNLLSQLIKRYDSFKIYNGIYFLDFSVYAKNSNYVIIDFETYELREQSNFLHGYEEIRIDLIGMK